MSAWQELFGRLSLILMKNASTILARSNRPGCMDSWVSFGILCACLYKIVYGFWLICLSWLLIKNKTQVLIKWWLGLPLFEDGAICGPQETLEKLGHHATTCKQGPRRNNTLWDTRFNFLRCTLLSPELEKGSSLDHLLSQTCPADILIPSWSMGKAAACDVTVVHPFNLSMYDSWSKHNSELCKQHIKKS